MSDYKIIYNITQTLAKLLEAGIKGCKFDGISGDTIKSSVTGVKPRKQD